jgi:hypothetical protein
VDTGDGVAGIIEEEEKKDESENEEYFKMIKDLNEWHDESENEEFEECFNEVIGDLMEMDVDGDVWFTHIN